MILPVGINWQQGIKLAENTYPHSGRDNLWVLAPVQTGPPRPAPGAVSPLPAGGPGRRAPGIFLVLRSAGALGPQ